jgi:uncharacterized damage-inducible protein DinB
MNELLLRLIAHMRWADRLVADALESAAPPDADAVRLFGHIAAVEHLWYCRIRGDTPRYAVWPDLSPPEARRLCDESADLFEHLLRDADTTSLAASIAYRNSAGRDYQSPVSEIVIHTAMHGEHHRGQIARLLRAAGREPPYTDYIQFSRRDE